MTDLIESLPDDARSAAEEADQPEWLDPMLATLTDDRFDDPDWIYERKLDGARLLAYRSGSEVRLMSRNRKERNATFPEVIDALEALDAPDFIVDGEVVTFEGDVTSFSRLQDRLHVEDEDEARARADRIRVYYYVFDVLHADGWDVTGVPLRSRKNLLMQMIDFEDPLRFTPHRNENGTEFWEEACDKGWEGIIAKDGTSEYVHSRSKSWLKFKCVHQQEFVVGGFTDPEGERVGFGALLLGYYEDDDLIYAGEVGTGWDDETLKDLRSRMDGLERKTSPFAGDDVPEKGVHWVTPKIVGEVGFTEWTDDGYLRHPRWVGRRADKDPEDVHREAPGGSP